MHGNLLMYIIGRNGALISRVPSLINLFSSITGVEDWGAGGGENSGEISPSDGPVLEM